MSNARIQKTDGIILRRQPLRETSLLLILYTRDFGKIKGVMKGVRGPRGQLGSFPEMLTLDRIVFYESKRSELFYITQCDLLDMFQNIRMDLERTGYATYLAELTDASSVLGDSNEELFDLLLNSLKLLCSRASAKRVARIFEIKLLRILGLMPGLNGCMQCGNKTDSAAKLSLKSGGLLCARCMADDSRAVAISAGTVNFIKHIEKAPYEKASRIKVSRQVGEELESVLRKFLDMHIDRKLKTLEFLRKVELTAKY